MDSNSSLGPFSFLFVYDLSSIAPSIELLSVLRVARPLQMKHSSLNLGPFFFFLWFELHGSFYWTTLNAKNNSTVGSEGPKFKLKSFFIYLFLWFKLHHSLC